nr:iaa-amino acid hydrolase ilr1-like 5 [Quercus suber]
MRSLTTEGLHQLRQRLKEVIAGQAAVHRCNAYIDMKEEDYPLMPAVAEGGQTFAWSSECQGNSLPAFPFFLDEDVLPIGSALHTSLAEIYLSEHQRSLVQ